MSNGQRKTVVVTHKCCYGFERIPGEMGCTKMVMKPLAETVADLGADEFLDLVEVRILLITGPIGYSDSAGKPKKCHCKRLSLYPMIFRRRRYF